MKHNESKNNLEYDLLSKGLENLNDNLQLTHPQASASGGERMMRDAEKHRALWVTVMPRLRLTVVTGPSLTFPTLSCLWRPAAQPPAHITVPPLTPGERRALRSCSRPPYRHDELLHTVGCHAG